MIKIADCNHIRIRDGNAYGIDIEKFVHSVEKELKIDFRSLPQWKEIVKRLHVINTDCKRRIQDSKYRKMIIIHKLYNESIRLSPFELTENLARTSKKWQIMEHKRNKRKNTLKLKTDIISNVKNSESLLNIFNQEKSEGALSAHPNTEIIPSEEIFEMQVKSKPEMDAKISTPTHLPVNICINQHKLVSPLTSPYSYVSYKTNSVVEEVEMKTIGKVDEKEWLLLNKTLSITSSPKEIIIDDESMQEQVINFSVINFSTKFVFVRFICVTEKTPFKWAKILPVTPLKLCPGLRIKYKFIFKLIQNIKDFGSSLYFRIGHDILIQAPLEALCIPVRSRFKAARLISVSKVVSIPPVYQWHIQRTCGFPSGCIKIAVDKNIYNVHIIKRTVDFVVESKKELLSLQVVCSNTESLKEMIDDPDVEIQSKPLTPKDNVFPDIEIVNSIDVIILVVHDIIELALEPFIFEHTYLKLLPYSKHNISVYFTKAERIGSHHCCYDLEFSDPNTEEIIITKQVKIFADVLPHPINIYPNILDISESPIRHGFCEDSFTITNSHKVCPVTVKIMLTTKMKKILHINPLEVLIPATSRVKFEVKFYSTRLLAKKPEEFVHFTFKIIIKGNQTLYHHVPPLFYEIIAPCVLEFKKIYNKKYYP